MSCMTLFVQEATMATIMTTATIDCTHAVCHEVCRPWQRESEVEHSDLRMSWVITVDEQGKRRLRARWSLTLGNDR
ncbi:MAG TPA: hypothetical protein VKZ53_09865 [Candidatus Angelobacter sp.]|nr:hypothetical protein [Candidatus Angelobacter sp.]